MTIDDRKAELWAAIKDARGHHRHAQRRAAARSRLRDACEEHVAFLLAYIEGLERDAVKEDA